MLQVLKDSSDQKLLKALLGSDMSLPSIPLVDLFRLRVTGMLTREDSIRYADCLLRLEAAKELMGRALASQLRRTEVEFSDTSAVKDYLRLTLSGQAYESFWCLWLDSHNRLIVAEEAFRGTLTQTSVYPRELAKRALELNAANVILAHNHPSGCVEPSGADNRLTQHVKLVLKLIDVKVLDHLIVGSTTVMSMAERGLV
jgi:DNA repair protein RadC